MFWDFDGTLAQRPGLWSGCVLEVLDQHEPAHSGTLDSLRTALAGGFPWHRHTVAHPELADPDAWWRAVTPLIERALLTCGARQERVGELARAVRTRFVDAQHWQLFDDTLPALEMTAAAGWRNAVISNHVPELPQLVERLGLARALQGVFNSAQIGYEKPHPEVYRHALRACGEPPRRWMVGDNPVADIRGSEAAGIPAVLVRTRASARRVAPDLLTAARLITRDPSTRTSRSDRCWTDPARRS